MTPLPWLAGALGLLTAAALSTCHHDQPSPAQRVRTELRVSAASGDLAKRSAAQADRAAARTLQSQAVADEAEDEVHHAPTASDPIDPDLRRAVLDGVRRLCEQSDSAGSPACDPSAPVAALPAR